MTDYIIDMTPLNSAGEPITSSGITYINDNQGVSGDVIDMQPYGLIVDYAIIDMIMPAVPEWHNITMLWVFNDCDLYPDDDYNPSYWTDWDSGDRWPPSPGWFLRSPGEWAAGFRPTRIRISYNGGTLAFKLYAGGEAVAEFDFVHPSEWGGPFVDTFDLPVLSADISEIEFWHGYLQIHEISFYGIMTT